MIDAEKSDLYDVLAYIAYASPPITRNERVVTRRSVILANQDAKKQAFLAFVLDHYVEQGVGELDDAKLPQLLELRYHDLRDAVNELGSVAGIRGLFIGFQQHLYARRAAA